MDNNENKVVTEPPKEVEENKVVTEPPKEVEENKVVTEPLKEVEENKNSILIVVGDHYEIDPSFVGILKYIDLSLLDTENLKVSGIDFRGTNIKINPQKVYKKDLSKSSFDDDNLFGSFNGVNLCGADISEESLPIDIENAITDANSKLPVRAVSRY